MAKITQDYNLEVINPNVAKQWHPKKNGTLTPKDVTPGSSKRVWWICGKGHEWQAAIADKSKGKGCPYCSGRKACEDNCLETVNPALAKQWHPTKNGSLTPRDVVPASHKKIWWICSKGHEWQARVASRNSGSGCPYCSGHRLCEENCLQTVNPGLAKDWHPSKNGSLTPKDVVSHSNKKVWWICDRGHEWEALINNRSNGRGCPHCARERKSNGGKTRSKRTGQFWGTYKG